MLHPKMAKNYQKRPAQRPPSPKWPKGQRKRTSAVIKNVSKMDQHNNKIAINKKRLAK